MSAHHGHGHGLFDWLRLVFGWHHEPQQPTGWQRTREQDTDGYRLTGLLDGIVGGEHWDGVPGSWTATYRQRGNTPIPATPQDTGGMTRILSARERHNRRVLGEKPTDRQLPGPDWLYANVPNGALPERYGNAPVQRRQSDAIATNTGRLDAMMATFLPQGQDCGQILDYNKIVSDKLSKLPPPVPAPDEMVAAFTDDAFLLALPKLDPMDSQEIATVDRTACSKPVTSALKQLEALASHHDEDDTKEVPAYMRWKHTKGE